MRSSPWLALMVVAPLLLLCGWAIFRPSPPSPAPAPESARSPESALAQARNSPAQTTTEPSTGETLVPSLLELQASPGLVEFRLQAGPKGEIWRWDAANLPQRQRLRLPPARPLPLQIQARWESAAKGPVALTVSLLRRGEATPQPQTFWVEADAQGAAVLDAEMLLPGGNR